MGIFSLDVQPGSRHSALLTGNINMNINEPTADEPSANNTHETHQDGGGSAGPNIHLYITERWGEGMGREMYRERERVGEREGERGRERDRERGREREGERGRKRERDLMRGTVGCVCLSG